MKSEDKAHREGAKLPADSMDTLQQAWLQFFTQNGVCKQDHAELFITTNTLLLLYIHALAKMWKIYINSTVNMNYLDTNSCLVQAHIAEYNVPLGTR